MKKITLGKLINDYTDILDSGLIDKLKVLTREISGFAEMSNKLRSILFREDTDFMGDSGVEAKQRKHGKNPMSKEYIEKARVKRIALGVTPLNSAGETVDNTSMEFCEEVIRRTGKYSEALERKKRKQKDIVYVDMDNVLVNFQSGIDAISEDLQKEYKGRLDEVPGIFSKMIPNEGAIEGYEYLCKKYEVYILSTAPWENPSAWSDKLLWVKKFLGEVAHKRLILSHHKNLLNGQYIIDDRLVRGVSKFNGKHIYFGQLGFESWKEVIDYLK